MKPAVLIGSTVLAALLMAGCSTSTDNTGSSPTRTGPQNPRFTDSNPGGGQGGGSGQTGTQPSQPTQEPGANPPIIAAPEQPPAGSPRPKAANPNQRCHTADLTGQLQQRDPAAGNRYAILILTNRSARGCTIYGYGGVGLVDAKGKPVPTQQRRDRAHGPVLINLPRGGKVSSLLHWGVVPGDGEPQTGQCEPTAAALLVIPPDETTSLRVPWTFGPVCQRGAIDQWAYRPGIVSA